MNDNKDEHGELLPFEDRVTKIVLFIRKYIPQLINVLKSDMSLIGSRPLLVKYLSLYNNWQKKRYHVKSGITRWLQVNGRNNITWKQKFKYNV